MTLKTPNVQKKSAKTLVDVAWIFRLWFLLIHEYCVFDGSKLVDWTFLEEGVNNGKVRGRLDKKPKPK